MGKRLEEEVTYKAYLPLVGPFGALCFALLCLSRAFEGERRPQCSGVLLLGTAGLAAPPPRNTSRSQKGLWSKVRGHPASACPLALGFCQTSEQEEARRHQRKAGS